MTQKKIIVGNWKMNLNMHEASLYLHELSKLVKNHRDVEIVLAPSILTLQSLSLQVNLNQFKLAVQNFYWRDHGPYTGEVSAMQLRGIVQYGIIGHSARRHIFNESDTDIRNKVEAAIRNGIKPILCIGETALERANDETYDALRDQLTSGLANITSEEIDKIVIAYEPVSAVGTGNIMPPDDVVSAIRSIRNQIKHLYGPSAAESIRVIYGGSVTSDNTADYIVLPGVDGLLIGESSLKSHEFNSIIEKVHKSFFLVTKEK